MTGSIVLANDVPRSLHANLLLTGSLAAAYHYRDGAHSTVRTKDADLVAQPAGAIDECREIAKQLIAAGWRPEQRMKAGRATDPDKTLWVIRLHPPAHALYFVELLGMPAADQQETKRWVRIELSGTGYDGWYVVPCFRYMAMFTSDMRMSEGGIPYASPPLMALANLLSHPAIGPEKIADSEDLRSARFVACERRLVADETRPLDCGARSTARERRPRGSEQRSASPNDAARSDWIAIHGGQDAAGSLRAPIASGQVASTRLRTEASR